jgi:hypothetical protein
MLSHSKEAAFFSAVGSVIANGELEDLRGRESSGPSTQMPKRPDALL